MEVKKINKRAVVNSLKKYADKNDMYFDYKKAYSGTYYVTLNKTVTDYDNDYEDTFDKTFKIRVADHQDAYGDSDYTIDNIEGTLKGCKEFLKKELIFDNVNKKNNFSFRLLER